MSSETVEYGAILHNGTVDWGVHLWFGDLDTVEKREAFQLQYDAQLTRLGVDTFKVDFLTRVRKTSVSEPQPLVD